MAPIRRTPTPEQTSIEDPDTAAARKELRQTVISDKPDLSVMSTAAIDPAPKAATSDDKASSTGSTPDRETLQARSDGWKEKIQSPKKKRAHDEVDEPKDVPATTNGGISPIGTESGASLGRTDRSEPEKKRPRDVSSEIKAKLEKFPVRPPSSPPPPFPSEFTTDRTQVSSEPVESTESAQASDKVDKPAGEEPTKATSPDDPANEKKTTSASAFNNSILAGFATQTSPFLQAGAKLLSSFASPSGSKSPFGTAGTTPTLSAFGSASLSNAPSPFGQVGASKPFGSSAFGGTFGGGAGAPTLTSFGNPGEILKSSKPAKPFGAPASEDEDDTGGDDNNYEEVDGDEDNETRDEKSAVVDDKKKPKLHRVVVDDGEAGEATILQVHAKIYHLDKASSSWKERGAGNLKINVPQACVDVDEESGAPIPGSFDASALEDAESKVVRLVMRQDSTHRVILNTAVIPAMRFQEKSTVKATCVLFTAIEDDGAVSIQIKMNAANAKSFLNEVGKIQRELQSA
ncbi:hypothetical protein GGS23DRAFT_282583 [Durotheca rogersii]|uniref:uncharacterized protein n=1 Tax=Durotheca rogersii TaxID=419775 RepID=UPI00221E4501|nr:uncharacterized protein GGS23DRAFT_282583 [Durotheca rogersii]KAI5866678.1 hypothetical protein GGS23DRAFT_282583 [Durotheca rogersii]